MLEFIPCLNTDKIDDKKLVNQKADHTSTRETHSWQIFAAGVHILHPPHPWEHCVRTRIMSILLYTCSPHGNHFSSY